MAASTLIWACIILLRYTSAQRIGVEEMDVNNICKSVFVNRMDKLNQLNDCVVIMGNLHVVVLEPAHNIEIRNITFPKLREVTGFVVFYRVKGLESIGSLFPNLAVIRGKQVLYHYALIIYDMVDLKEVGLYSLVRIENGGVIVWAVPNACYIHTINWELIAPQARHVLSPIDPEALCSDHCSCTASVATNMCWNIWKCQRYLKGPDAYVCNEQCLDCRNTNSNICSVCRYRTSRGLCVPECPPNTFELVDSGYCVTTNECRYLDGWAWNKKCVFNCSVGFKKQYEGKTPICVPCEKCYETCGSITLHTLRNIQDAARCVRINGSLTISIKSLPNVMEELKAYLGHIEEVYDYVAIYTIPKAIFLDFLPSLRRIRGRNLRNGTYSLLIYDMTSLQTLFTENVTSNLKIDRGTVFLYNNPMLCLSEVDKIVKRFPVAPNSLDIPQGANGYSGGCMKTSISINVKVINETSVSVNFSHIAEPHAHYSILYIRLPQGSREAFVPEMCSDTEWYAVNVPHEDHKLNLIELTTLLPASKYALCVEKYNPVKNIIARSDIVNFTTPVGKPEPSFILELVASSSEVVVLRWVDHKLYQPHIKQYELDVSLVDIRPQDITARDHCRDVGNHFDEIDMFRHAVVMRPPADYDRGCESMCGILSSVTAGAMVEEYFDICNSIHFGCNIEEAYSQKNSSYEKFVRTLSLTLKGPRNDFQVGGLAPFRDYRFRLRACSSEQCSRSARGVVRTLRSKYADMPTLIYAIADENGFISVKWEPPELTNGPILSYTVHVMPSIKIERGAQLIPQTWCFSGTEFKAILKSVKTEKYLVRVCSTSLGTNNVCSENKRVVVSSSLCLWYGVIFGIILFLATTISGCYWKKRRDDSNYELLLLSNMVVADTEPPVMMMSDFADLYSIPLRDTLMQ